MFVVGVAVAEVIPAGTGPLRHGVGFALELVGVIDPIGGAQKGATGVAGGLEVFHLGLEKGEFAFGERGVVAGLFVPKEREGLAPVALAREKPVAEFKLNFAGAFAFALEPVDDFSFGFFSGEAVEEVRVYGGSVAGETLPVFVAFGLHHLGDGELELFGELEVAFVVGGDGHDGAGAVAHHHVVCNPDGDGLLVDGIDGVCTGEDAAFVLVEVAAIEVGFVGAGVLVGFDCVGLFGLVMMSATSGCSGARTM